MAAMTEFELTDLVYDERRGGYWLKPLAERSAKTGRCQSPAEVVFWNAAVSRLPGLVRQFRIEGTRYHVDFAVPERLLAIEIDGYGWHSTRQQRQHDSQRDRTLQGKGWRVFRFTASEILRNADGCVDELLPLLAP